MRALPLEDTIPKKFTADERMVEHSFDALLKSLPPFFSPKSKSLVGVSTACERESIEMENWPIKSQRYVDSTNEHRPNQKIGTFRKPQGQPYHDNILVAGITL